MDGLIDDLSRRPEDIEIDLNRLALLLERIYLALSNPQMPPKLKRFLLSTAVDLEDEVERQTCYKDLIEMGLCQ